MAQTSKTLMALGFCYQQDLSKISDLKNKSEEYKVFIKKLNRITVIAVPSDYESANLQGIQLGILVSESPKFLVKWLYSCYSDGSVERKILKIIEQYERHIAPSTATEVVRNDSQRGEAGGVPGDNAILGGEDKG